MGAEMKNAMPRLLVGVSVLLSAGSLPLDAQTTVQLPKLVLETRHTEYVATQNPGTPAIVNVRSSNPSVATAAVYRVSSVQIVAVAPGSTDVEFFDTAERKLYKLQVFVTAPNATGGGGAGFDGRKTQLEQIVMLAKRTQNVTVPGGGSHQISGVASSNPSVATARTNTANTIQIYSVALGDTFVDFTDNVTGTTYQVHVWVRDTLPGPSGGGGSGNAGSGSNPKPNPNPNPMPGPRPGQMDSKLVGRWVLESSTFTLPTSGGAGATFTIQANGNLSADYSGMSKIVFSDGGSYLWTGTASGHISAETGLLVADRVDQSSFAYDILDPHGKSTLTNGWGGWNKTLGAILPPSGPGRSLSYECTGSTLTVVQTFNTSKITFVLKRQQP